MVRKTLCRVLLLLVALGVGMVFESLRRATAMCVGGLGAFYFAVGLAAKIQEMREKEPDPSSYVPDGYAPKLQHKAELAREAQRRSEMVTPRRAEGELPTPDEAAAPMDVG